MKLHMVTGLLLILASACATTKSNTAAPISYSETARQNFELAERAMAAGKGEEALAHFEHVRNKYPYSKYAADADLKIADAYFAQEKWLEASDAYDFFIRFHPVHDSVATAYFKKAKANVNAMPADFFLFPKSYTKDQTTTKDALEAIDQFLVRFPLDPNTKEAKELRLELREKIVLKHLDVARFYAARKKWKGANMRYEEIVKTFADTPSAKEAFLELASVKRDHLDQKDESKELLERIVKEFPESPEAKTALNMLKEEAGSKT